MFELGNIGGYFKQGMDTLGEGMDSLKKKTGVLMTHMKDVDDTDLGALADAEDAAGGAVAADLGTGAEALNATSEGVDWEAVSQMLGSIKPANQQQQQAPSSSPRGFRHDSNLYENKLLTREYGNLYNQPLYTKLG